MTTKYIYAWYVVYIDCNTFNNGADVLLDVTLVIIISWTKHNTNTNKLLRKS